LGDECDQEVTEEVKGLGQTYMNNGGFLCLF